MVRVAGLGCCHKQLLSAALSAANIYFISLIYQKQSVGSRQPAPVNKITPLLLSGVILLLEQAGANLQIAFGI